MREGLVWWKWGLMCLLCAGTVVCQAATPKPKRPGQVVQTPQKLESIELAHSLDTDSADQLAQVVARFNATSPPLPVSVVKRDVPAASSAELVLLNQQAGVTFLAGKPGVRPLHQVMAEAGASLETFRPPPTLAANVVDSQNRLLALPIALGTPVLFYNRDAIRAAGANPDQPPATWQALQGWLGALNDRGVACPYTTADPVWVHIENTSAWHNEPVANGSLNLNGLLQVKHLALMSSWYKSRYLRIFGRGDEAHAHFVSGECPVLTANSSAYPAFVRNARFEVGVAPLPHHEDYFGAPQNTLSNGSALWVAQGKSAAQYKAIAAFMEFLLTAQSQVELQRNLGGLPLNRAGAYAARGDLMKDDLASVRVAISTLTHKPATEVSRASTMLRRAEVQKILNEALEALWANQKPAKQALDDAVALARRAR